MSRRLHQMEEAERLIRRAADLLLIENPDVSFERVIEETQPVDGWRTWRATDAVTITVRGRLPLVDTRTMVEPEPTRPPMSPPPPPPVRRQRGLEGEQES